jgi:rRNA-processing protein EBP2
MLFSVFQYSCILERKNTGGADDEDGDFNIAVDEEQENKRPKKQSSSKISRAKRDSKFGFGGKKRHMKSNTRESTDDFDFQASKNKQAPSSKFQRKQGPKQGKKGKKEVKRPGKSKRQSMRG